jgi:hypothetical protein
MQHQDVDQEKVVDDEGYAMCKLFYMKGDQIEEAKTKF